MALVIRMVEEMPVILSGDRPVDTEPVAELSRALATLLRGQLYPPPGTLWCFGRPGGRMTMPLPGTATDG
ncbi:hypothetical protein [Actinoplanes sp. NPDC051494]|uniref:hypothetical protein n=1 Tax=Actinoplanes sp. NPDC051494 TaxID=3363907 RepID=UPI0037B50A86